MLDSIRIRRMRESQENDLNLAPFLDVMVVLIPFLMFSASFATMVALPTSLPTPVSSAPKDIRPPFDLVARATSDSIEIYLNPTTPTSEPNFSIATGKGDDYAPSIQEQLHKVLVGIKREHPGETRIALDAAPGVSLQRISSLLDQARDLVPSDTGIPQMADQPARSLFPQVALKGVYVP